MSSSEQSFCFQCVWVHIQQSQCFYLVSFILVLTLFCHHMQFTENDCYDNKAILDLLAFMCLEYSITKTDNAARWRHKVITQYYCNPPNVLLVACCPQQMPGSPWLNSLVTPRQPIKVMQQIPGLPLHICYPSVRHRWRRHTCCFQAPW